MALIDVKHRIILDKTDVSVHANQILKKLDKYKDNSISYTIKELIKYKSGRNLRMAVCFHSIVLENMVTMMDSRLQYERKWWSDIKEPVYNIVEILQEWITMFHDLAQFCEPSSLEEIVSEISNITGLARTLMDKIEHAELLLHRCIPNNEIHVVLYKIELVFEPFDYIFIIFNDNINRFVQKLME